MDYNKLLKNMNLITERIYEILNEDNFAFSIDYLNYMHNYLFKDILPNSGHYRTYDIYKPEHTLNGDSVLYECPLTIETYLSYVFKEEILKDYSIMSINELIINISNFNVKLWKIHPYIEGNTRTIAVFMEKFLNSLGFNVNNDIFKENHLYYRFALAKASYTNEEFDVEGDMMPIISFYQKLLIDHNIILKEEDLFEMKLFNKKKKKKRYR